MAGGPVTAPEGRAAPALPREMGLRDVVLFNITAIVGLRWLTTAGRIGPLSLVLWGLAMVIFFLPSAMAVRELTDIDPSEGGLYCWVTRAFGPKHGFIAGWGYWVNNLVYYPSLLLTSAAIAAYVGGPRFVPLAESKWFIALFSLGMLWIALGLNLVGLRVGKWVQNLGAYGTWVPAAIFVALAAVSFASHGSATTFSASAFRPAKLDLSLLSLFATMTFAFAGLELAPTLGGEIRDPAATLRRGIVWSGVGIVATYVLGTLAILVALPADAVNLTNGVPQAAAAIVERLGGGWLVIVPALVAALLTLGNLGGAGAWIAGSARIPFVAGVDRVLPPAFGAVHPRWRTPYVALLVQGGVATVFVAAGLIGSTVGDAYLVLVDTTIVLFFIPYLYLFAAYLKLRRHRTAWSLWSGVIGFAAVVLSIVLSFIPGADIKNPVAFEVKVIAGVVGFMGVGFLLVARSGRRSVAAV
jgi:amino acid transporter